jgi:hypothetical protein
LELKQCMVRRLQRVRVVHNVLVQRIRHSAAVGVDNAILANVCDFLGQGPVFSVKVEALVGILGHKGGVPCPGALMRLLTPPKGIVRVEGFKVELIPSRVCRSLDMDSRFCAQSWHVVRLHHRSRCFTAPESCRERDGSLLHQLWDAEQHPPPAVVVDRLKLMERGAASSVLSQFSS